MAGLQCLRRQLLFGDIDEGDDDALYAAFEGSVRHHAADIPGAGTRFDLSLDRCERPQDRKGIRGKGFVGGQGAEIRDRPPDVARDDVEEQLRRRREEANVQTGVEEERRDIGAVQDILQVIRRRALLLQCFMELAVEGRSVPR